MQGRDQSQRPYDRPRACEPSRWPWNSGAEPNRRSRSRSLAGCVNAQMDAGLVGIPVAARNGGVPVRQTRLSSSSLSVSANPIQDHHGDVPWPSTCRDNVTGHPGAGAGTPTHAGTAQLPSAFRRYNVDVEGGGGGIGGVRDPAGEGVESPKTLVEKPWTPPTTEAARFCPGAPSRRPWRKGSGAPRQRSLMRGCQVGSSSAPSRTRRSAR